MLTPHCLTLLEWTYLMKFIMLLSALFINLRLEEFPKFSDLSVLCICLFAITWFEVFKFT